ncbi:RIP metalloprotease RseP [Candidatus Fermentibacterales bacterium]|nr:RIP metalloprotease RseP [Candidatus Fermentibacterales bacterium]
MTILAVVVGLGCIVLVHELGHFLVAKAVGLPVERFSIGFPPTLVRFRSRKTEYCLGAIPLGGYVKVRLGTEGGEPPDRPWYLRILVVLAGPASNLLLAAVLFVVILGLVGQQQPMLPTVVGDEGNLLGIAPGDTILEVDGRTVSDYQAIASAMTASGGNGTMVVGGPDGRREVGYDIEPDQVPGFEPLQLPVVGEAPVGLPAYEAGLRPGDLITGINGKPVTSWSQFRESVQRQGGNEMEVEVLRDGAEMEFLFRPVDIDGTWRVGVVVLTETVRLKVRPFGLAVRYGIEAALRGAGIFYESIAMLFTRPREIVEMSGGPVFAAETLGQQAGMGFGRFLETVAVISIAIMGFNLLPLPILDGGHVIFLLFEGIFGRPLSRRKIQIAQQIGFFIILSILVLVMWRDLARIISRG